jgi:hypothetical protein
MDDSGIDSMGSGEGGSVTTAMLESLELLFWAALADGLGASLAKAVNAGANRTASVTAIVIFILNLIVFSKLLAAIVIPSHRRRGQTQKTLTQHRVA